MSTDFINYTLTTLVPDSPFVYFDDSANTFIISGASHFSNTQTTASGGGITSGIQSNIATLPARIRGRYHPGRRHQLQPRVRVLGPGTAVLHRQDAGRRQRHACAQQVGYWTDTAPPTTTRPRLAQTTRRRSRMWQPTSRATAYRSRTCNLTARGTRRAPPSHSPRFQSCFNTYDAQKDLFPDGLSAFQQSLGIGLITHNRWLRRLSPYRSQYQVSGNTVIDPAFWTDRAAYLKSSGVMVYEQDWLSRNGLPNQDDFDRSGHLPRQHAKAIGAAGLDIQYCMPLARHIMQSTKYNSVTNSRVSPDGFASGNYMDFFHGSGLAWSVRLWPSNNSFHVERARQPTDFLTCLPVSSVPVTP